MDITPHVAQDAKVIQRYGPGRFTISGEVHEGTVLVTPTAVASWTDKPMADWQEADLAPLFALEPPPDLVLIGTGRGAALLPASLKALLRGHSLGFDGMDTGAACRTYNVLLAEARRVAAVLVAVD